MANSKYDKPKCDCENALYARRNEIWLPVLTEDVI